jgi:hypothetical protein
MELKQSAASRLRPRLANDDIGVSRDLEAGDG